MTSEVWTTDDLVEAYKHGYMRGYQDAVLEQDDDND